MAKKPIRTKLARKQCLPEEIPKNFPKFGDVYKHYKQGHLYTVICPVTQESTGDVHIVYQCRLSGNNFVRPYREWHEIVGGYKFAAPLHDIPVARFTRVSP